MTQHTTDTTGSSASTESSSRSASTSTRSRRNAKQRDPGPEVTPTPPPPSVDSDSAFRDDPLYIDIKTNLHQNPFFLGRDGLLSAVSWVPAGRRLALVQNGVDDGEPKVPAVLQWVGEINPSSFWLYACAGWNGARGPNDAWTTVSPFENAKARGHIRQPGWPLFSQDWTVCLKNLNRLMTSAKTLDSVTSYSLIEDEEIKIRHSIFEVSDAITSATALPIVYLITAKARRFIFVWQR
jgi:hypothetical protein